MGSIYADFFLPQQELSRIATGQAVVVTTDTYSGRSFSGKITTISPKVDTETRNFQAEALIANPRHELLPGMYATIDIRAGTTQRYLTVPQTAITFNPYGDTVYIAQESGKGPDNKPLLTVKQAFVTLGPTRGDQVAVLTGVKEGDTVVTSGQLKLKNGSAVIINNQVQPSNEEAPKPEDQ
jgi:membrane fusion protein (multidrug efflux system)